jgi:DNA-binding response OmpR family regulator
MFICGENWYNSAMATHILTVDDDALMRRSLTFTLEQAGYRVSSAGSGEEALARVDVEPPDLMLLDIGLPGIDGLEVLRQLQQRCDLPVIFLTARRRELEQVLGLELGADDYVTKPFDADVLLARIRAVLRRSQRHFPAPGTPSNDLLIVGDLAINTAAHSVAVASASVELSRREFDLLHALALEPGNVLSADDLLSRVWGDEFVGEPQVLYVHMRRLREKLEETPNKPTRLVTVRGVGYKLVAHETG